MAITWLARSLHFCAILFETLAAACAGTPASEALPPVNTSSAIGDAYTAVLMPYHSWVLRGLFRSVNSQVPSFPALIKQLSSRRSTDDWALLAAGMRELHAAAMPLVGRLERDLVAQRLDDGRKA